MKKTHSLALLLVTLTLTGGMVFAQENSPIYVVTTFETIMPDNGRSAERDSLLALWQEHVIKKNDLIVSEMNLRHLMGSNSGQWVVVTEYRNWADIDAAANRNDELFRQKWTTPEERRAFNRAFFSYFGNHSDEVYTSMANLKK